ncbi:MAG: hypothetical protein OER80_04000 [Gammaproteobacteria bacterium]|nr:hypothetical protein [Gammaproteobacteria bacterium]MDH3767780.1 hypothetical protein [Gammaproteobacteria bacterium]
MSGLSLFLVLFAAAILSSALTCLTLWLYYRQVVEPKLEQRIEIALEALGEKVGERVRTGVVDGFTDIAAGDTLRRTTEKVATSGAALVDEGLNVLLGKPRRKR